MNHNLRESADEGHQFRLLRERRFLPFFLTQFLGAFNDNFYKNALVILVVFHGASLSSLDADTLVNLSAGIFILPFFLFSAQAGQLADKYEKSRLIRYIKLFEIAIMVCGAWGILSHKLWLLMGALFLMGAHSTLFGPVKYAILPQVLREEELVGGNALLESGTFLAILLGAILGGVLVTIEPWGQAGAAGTVVFIACLGWLVSRSIPPAPAPDPAFRLNWDPMSETWRILRFMGESRVIFLSVLGISWFWLYGATFLSQFPNYGKEALGGSEQVVTLLLTAFSIGIGIGSLLCERLSGAQVELGLVPFGSIGLSLFAIDLYLATPQAPIGSGLGALEFLGHWEGLRIVIDLFLIAVFGGFYIVPLYALIQNRSEPGHRARVIAGNNILNALFMVISAGLALALLKAGFSIAEIFLATGLANAVVAFYIYTLVPEFLARFIVWLLVHTAYQVEKHGLEHIPESGPALLLGYPASPRDALLLAAACRRPIRFVVDQGAYRRLAFTLFFRASRAIALPSGNPRPPSGKALEMIVRSSMAGELVSPLIAAGINTAAKGDPIHDILARNSAPVVPFAIKDLATEGGSSRLGQRRFAVAVGTPLAPGEATPERLRQALAALHQQQEPR